MSYKDFLRKGNRIAVVGATDNTVKWGYRIFSRLRELGFSVFPVNPKKKEIAGAKCYPDLSSLPSVPDMVTTVVKPEVTENIVEECRKLGIKKVWMQPGSESKKAVMFCRENKIEVVHDSCFVVSGLKEGW